MWHPYFGANYEGNGTRFRAWAPGVSTIDVVIYRADDQPQIVPMKSGTDGCYEAFVNAVEPGALYKFRVNNELQFPDPASKFQPEGVHGPGQVIDLDNYHWQDSSWKNPPLEQLVFYETHIGTFTEAGTFAGVKERLSYLKDLGITALQLMPVADFPGRWNWGYDGVMLYAPARCYGPPQELCQLIDAAHALGLAVFLDVVYNHFGPDGNYTGVYGSQFESKKHHSPWGAGLNFDDAGSALVRRFFIDNAIYWLKNFHFDGLRLDATHAIIDDSKLHFLAELNAKVKEACGERTVYLIAEDHRNLGKMLQSGNSGGYGLDGVWADDFHHQNRCLLAGDNEGYYADFTGSTTDLAKTIQQGWFYTGQFSQHSEGNRGTDPSGIPPKAFVVCIQNHDQIGNRAFGDRLHHKITPAAFRASSALLLCSPQTPLLFMGQEWSASTPFQFFTDHNAELGKLVTEGRRKEFRHFSAFTDPAVRETIPDPQALSTMQNCVLRWEELEASPHDKTLALYKALLNLRKSEPSLQSADMPTHQCFAINDNALALLRGEPATFLLICQLQESGTLHWQDIPQLAEHNPQDWTVVLTTEDANFATDPQPITITQNDDGQITFARPGAVLFRRG